MDLSTISTNISSIRRPSCPGTNMQFAGLNRGSERADVINYLHTLADSPTPLPKAAEAPK